jgi:hypothetical protein
VEYGVGRNNTGSQPIPQLLWNYANVIYPVVYVRKSERQEPSNADAMPPSGYRSGTTSATGDGSAER